MRKAYLHPRNNAPKKTCRRCILCGREDGLERHHVKPRARRGSNRKRNLVDLCRRCHRWVTDHPKSAYKIGLMRHAWELE